MIGPATFDGLPEAIAEMGLQHEAPPYGVPPSFSWYAGPEVAMGTNPQQAIPCSPENSLNNACYPQHLTEWKALLPWWTVFPASNAPPGNSCVELLGMDTLVMSLSKRKWSRLQALQSRSGDFGEYYAENIQPAGHSDWSSVDPATGRLRVRPSPSRCFHGWTQRSRTPWKGAEYAYEPDYLPICQEPSNGEDHDVGAVFVSVLHRLAILDEAGADDRSSAQYVVQAGADYWPTLTAPLSCLHPMLVLPGVGIGRFRLSRPYLSRSTFFCVHPSLAPLTGEQLKPLVGLVY